MESLLVQVRCGWSVTWYRNALPRVLLSIMAVLYHVTDHFQRAYFSRHYWRGILTIRISAIGFWCSGWRTKYHLQTKISCWKHRDSHIASQVSWRRECRPRTNIDCWKHRDSYKFAQVSWRSECHPRTKISCWKHRDSHKASQVSWRRECRPRTNINCWKHPDSYKAAEVSWRSECHP